MGDKGRRRIFGEVSPHMSTTSILVSVEDLIHMSMGPENKNAVNFKLLQTVLHILARQMRLLEQKVEVKITDYITLRTDEEKDQEDTEQRRTDRNRAVSVDESRRGEKDVARAEREAARTGKEVAIAAKEGVKAEKDAAKAEKEAQRTAEKEKKGKEKALAAEAKEKQKQEKALAKEEKAAHKEKTAAERAASKEREKEAKAGAKSAKEEDKERTASKERDEADKATGKDARAGTKGSGRKGDETFAKGSKTGTKGDRGAYQMREESDDELVTAGKGGNVKNAAKDEKYMTKDEKVTAREQEGAGGKGQETRGRARASGAKGARSDTSIVITVEKGPTTRSAGGVGGPGSSRSIEVVTRSQFELLQEMVSELSEKAGPLPMPSLPKNKELLQQLSKGTASLTDMMGAMQVNARVVAAEQAIGRMGGILTQLATAGALPEDIAGQVGEVTSELREAGGGGSVGGGGRSIGGDASHEAELDEAPASRSAASAASRKSILAARSKHGTASGTAPASTLSGSASSVFISKVTHTEMDDAVRALKEDMTKNMQQITAKAASAAETAVAMTKAVVEKLDVAIKLNGRISTLHSQVTDYAEQLSGFDTGLSTQMQGFSEQMGQMRVDLKQGLDLLDSVNNNAETAAVKELTERYEGLVSELDNTVHLHQDLTLHQGKLAEDLRGLIEAVEMLREQKADRDEVQDGLRDKADNSRLAGLLTEEEFARSRSELERRLALCHDKFNRQNEVWMQAVKDLKAVTDVKADLIQLSGLRDEAQEALRNLQQMCRDLALVLGEPKAAILTRKLTRGALCGACLAPALMEAEDEHAGAPPPLPAARPRPTGAPAVYEEPCERAIELPGPPDTREHVCHRWVGGSHTLVTQGVVTRAHAQPMTFDVPPTNKFTGYGQDGRLYMMEEELQPCIECNKLSDEAEIAGDKVVEALPPIEGNSD